MSSNDASSFLVPANIMNGHLISEKQYFSHDNTSPIVPDGDYNTAHLYGVVSVSLIEL